MIRQHPLRTTVLLAVTSVALTACATFESAGQVADVDGTTIGDDALDDLAVEFFERTDIFGTTEAATSSERNADELRFLIAGMVDQQIFQNFADRYDVDLDAERSGYISATYAEGLIPELSDDFQDLVADTDPNFRGLMLNDIATPSEDDLRAMYTDAPPSSGVVCMRHILVSTEDEANEVLDELNDGADFAELAAERSTDEVSAVNGGVLGTDTNDCLPLGTMVQGFDPGFASGALGLAENVASTPTQSSFGWHIILHRPWDEVGDDVLEIHDAGPSGPLLLDGYTATAPIDVSPRYGSWDALTTSVVPLG